MKNRIFIFIVSILLLIIGFGIYGGIGIFKTMNIMELKIETQTFDSNDYKIKKTTEIAILNKQISTIQAAFDDYIVNIQKLAALEPLREYLSEDEISEILKEIPTGYIFRGSFSMTAPFGESVGYLGSLRKTHGGVDLTPDSDDWLITPIADGIVTDNILNRIYGLKLIVQHTPRVRSTYSHGEKFYYRSEVGKGVQFDDAIMLMGSSGISDGPHLHFEIEVWTGENWIKINPYPFIRSEI